MSGNPDLLATPRLRRNEPGHEGVSGAAGQTPHLELEGFSGPLEQMLFLARAQKLDLAKLSLRDFLEQLTDGLRQDASINRKAEWVGMASWVVLLRSRLLLPVSPAVQQQAEADAETLQARLIALLSVSFEE